MRESENSYSSSGALGRRNQGLFRRLLLVAGVTLGLCVAVMMFFDHRLVDMLSRQLIEKSTQIIDKQLDGYFTAMDRSLLIIQEQLEQVDLFSDLSDAVFFRAFEPFLERNSPVSSVVMANGQGSSRVR